MCAAGGLESAGACAGGGGGGALGGADYKITLGRARANSAVTSTNPKTPSPSLNVRHDRRGESVYRSICSFS